MQNPTEENMVLPTFGDGPVPMLTSTARPLRPQGFHHLHIICRVPPGKALPIRSDPRKGERQKGTDSIIVWFTKTNLENYKYCMVLYYIVYYILYIKYFILYIIYYILYTIYYILCIKYFILYIIYYILYTIYYILYIKYFILYIIYFILYIIY